jgi:hypothetical protein
MTFRSTVADDTLPEQFTIFNFIGQDLSPVCSHVGIFHDHPP